jgi:hypothetical protein
LTGDIDSAVAEHMLAREVCIAADLEFCVPEISEAEAEQKGYTKVTSSMGARQSIAFISHAAADIGKGGVVACRYYASGRGRHQLSVWKRPPTPDQ